MIRLFNVSIPPATFILLLFESTLLMGSFLAATLMLGDLDPTDYLLYDSGLLALILVVISFLLGLHFQDLYTQIRVKSRVLLVQQLCMVTGIAFLAQALISYIDSDLRVSVRVMLVGSAIAVPGIFLWRLWFGNIARQMIGYTRLVMVGSGPVVTQFRQWIKDHPESGILVEASVERPEQLAVLHEAVKKQQPPMIVFSGWKKPEPELAQELIELQLSGYTIETAAGAYERASSRISIYSLRPEQLIYSASFAVAPQKFFYQAVLNVVVAAFCLAVITPILAITALALRLFEGAPVLERQTVVGLNGRQFRLYRFAAARGGLIARAVRKLQLDGLPQFLSVLKGDLAIVGPSALRPEYHAAIERHIPFYPERLTVRPGITGWAQIHSRLRRRIEDIADTLEYDLYYIKNRSLGLDTLILLHTLKRMMLEEQALEADWAGEQMTASTN